MKKKISIALGAALVIIFCAEIVMIGKMKNEHKPAAPEAKTEQTVSAETSEEAEPQQTESETQEETENVERVQEPEVTVEPQEPLEENGMLVKPEMDKTVLRPGLDTLKTALNEQLAEAEGDWSIYVRDLSDTTYMQIGKGPVEDNGFVRLCIMGTILEQIEAEQMEETEEVETLLSAMTAQDSYECANKLVELMDPLDHTFEEGSLPVWDYCLEYDLDETSLYTELVKPQPKTPDQTSAPTPTPQPDAAEEAETLKNLSSAADAAHFLEMVYTGDNVSGQASRIMEELLMQQTCEGCMASLDEEAQCGWISDRGEDRLSEAVIVYTSEDNFILTVTGNGLSDLVKAEETLKGICLEVYSQMCPKRAAAVKAALEETAEDEAKKEEAAVPAA